MQLIVLKCTGGLKVPPLSLKQESIWPISGETPFPIFGKLKLGVMVFVGLKCTGSLKVSPLSLKQESIWPIFWRVWTPTPRMN